MSPEALGCRSEGFIAVSARFDPLNRPFLLRPQLRHRAHDLLPHEARDLVRVCGAGPEEIEGHWVEGEGDGRAAEVRAQGDDVFGEQGVAARGELRPL